MRLISFLILVFALAACETKPKVPPSITEFKNSFYSLKQSGISEYRCEVIPKTVAELSDLEIDYLFKNQYSREATLQEKGMLRSLRWQMINSNEKQESIPSIRFKDFPTPQSADLAERLTFFLNLINKILTLSYLENFADRPDLKNVLVTEKFFKVISNLEEVAAEVEFNQKKYRIFYGEKSDAIEVTLQPLGSMKIPSEISLKSSASEKKSDKNTSPQTLDLFFDLYEGIPRLKSFNATAKPFKGIPIRFTVESCEFIK